jgi:Raf kinase inhibitor-like YbhB/YbcL family protein
MSAPMRAVRTTIVVALLLSTWVLNGRGAILSGSSAGRRATLAGSPAAHAQQRGGLPPPGAPGAPPPPGVPGGQPPGGQRGGGRGRGGVQVMTLSTTAWPDGGQIPLKHTQAGEEASPPLTWSGAPEGVTSYVLVVHDVDAAIGSGTDDILHWMLWNIPATATGVPERVPRGAQLPDGTRQISATGPNYRGPGAPAAGPLHHYVFELFALDTTIDVPAVGASPPQTRAAVAAAMAGHVRGKAVYVGLFRRP